MTETELRTDGDTRCAETHEPMTWNEAAGAYTHAGKCVFGREHRHLELTIHPLIPPNPWPEDEVIRSTSQAWWLESEVWDRARSVESDAMQDKCLTEPEAAAEYWYELTDSAPVDLDREDKVDAGELEPLPYILERFATLPHAASSDYE